MTYQRGCASLCLVVRDVLDMERDDSFNLALQHSFCSSAKILRCDIHKDLLMIP
jgi:hypothetical protein